MREIGQAVELKSTSSMAHQLVALERKGVLYRDPHTPRVYQVRHRWADELPGAPAGATDVAHVPLVGEDVLRLPLLHDLRLEGTFPVSGHLDLDRSDIVDHGLRPLPVPRVAAVLPGWIMPVIAKTVRHLTLESGLQQPLRQLLEQTALTGHLQGLGLSLDNNLVQEPVIHSRWRGPRFGRLGHVLAGHRCTLP
jgi:hypothetical protein